MNAPRQTTLRWRGGRIVEAPSGTREQLAAESQRLRVEWTYAAHAMREEKRKGGVTSAAYALAAITEHAALRRYTTALRTLLAVTRAMNDDGETRGDEGR